MRSYGDTIHPVGVKRSRLAKWAPFCTRARRVVLWLRESCLETYSFEYNTCQADFGYCHIPHASDIEIRCAERDHGDNGRPHAGQHGVSFFPHRISLQLPRLIESTS